MTLNSKAFLFAALLGLGASSPLTASLADPAIGGQVATMPSQNATGLYDPSQPGPTGVYDNFDQFRDKSGHPRQGYGYLFAIPGGG